MRSRPKRRPQLRDGWRATLVRTATAPPQGARDAGTSQALEKRLQIDAGTPSDHARQLRLKKADVGPREAQRPTHAIELVRIIRVDVYGQLPGPGRALALKLGRSLGLPVSVVGLLRHGVGQQDSLRDSIAILIGEGPSRLARVSSTAGGPSQP